MGQAELSFAVFRDGDGFGDSASVRFLRSSDLSLLGAVIPIDMTVVDNDWTTIAVEVVQEAAGETVLIEWNFVSDASQESYSGLSIDNIRVTD